MVLIGTLELLCLLAFPAGAIWLIVNLFRKKSKKKPVFMMILSFIGLMILVAISSTFYSDEMEQSRIERESREAEDASKKIKELEEKNKQLEKEKKKLEKENEKLNKVSENEKDSDLAAMEEYEEASSESAEEPVTTQAEETLSPENALLGKLKKELGDNVGQQAYDILVNQIGFTNLEYVKHTDGTGNYVMTSSEGDFILTAFSDDKVYRIFQPNGGAVFYEEDTLKMTVEELKKKAINHNDMTPYYMMAKEIVESGLKSPRSAKFPSIVTRPEEIAMSKNEDIIAVQSYVDAENSFGAMIRSKWTVQFEVIDISTYSYTPLYVNVDGEVLYGEWIDME